MTQSVSTTDRLPTGLAAKLAPMRSFFIIWFGQLVSIIGSGITAFALGVFVYQRTGSATNFALIYLAGALPRAVISPLAGVLADRMDRRQLMILSDIGAGLTVLVVLPLAITGDLALWHIYLVTSINSVFSSLRVPAYLASAATLIPKAQHGRVGGLIQLGDALGLVVAPVAAGALIALFQLPSVLMIDALTFTISLLTLLAVRIPRVQTPPTLTGAKGSFLSEIRYAWDYLVTRRGLLSLLLVFVIGNFFVGNAQALVTPMILSFASTEILGIVLSVGGVGMLLGGITLVSWGGGRRKIYTVLGAYIVLGIAILVAGLVPSASVVAAALFVAYFALPFIIGLSQAILASKVATEVQGRIFALRVMLLTVSFTVAYLSAGPLADYIFEPLMAVDGAFAASVGQLIGSGPGRGIGFMFVLIGLLATLTALSGLSYPRLRLVEKELPDVLHN